VQVGPGQANRLESAAGLDKRHLLVVEQVLAQPAQRLLAGTARAFGVRVQKMGAQLDVEPRPMGDAFAQYLDREVLGLEQVGISAL
jgi:hypothetical protein